VILLKNHLQISVKERGIKGTKSIIHNIKLVICVHTLSRKRIIELKTMTAIKKIRQLGAQWETQDPFLFCAYHLDNYPKGNSALGPDASLAGRNIGMDFHGKDGWNMYHGRTVPGFPAHPHRGFETITVVERGLADHSDSLGAAGRFGNGDVQWMTAGKGVQHSEMFPLLNQKEENPLLLFQLWLNLPRASKMVEPHYKMLWHEDIPVVNHKDANDHTIKVKIIAGDYQGTKALPPAPDSWAAQKEHGVQVWLVTLEAQATWEIPKETFGLNRTLYFYEGHEITTEGFHIPKDHGIDLLSDQDIIIQNGEKTSSFLFIQGKPIGEPVVKQGPFVMNSHQEIQEAIQEYRQTEFGGWPWPSHDHTHNRNKGRFAIHADGKEEIKKNLH